MSQMDSGMTSLGRTTSPLGGAVGKLPHLELQQIKQPKMHCGDCNSDDCQWASINRGVYLCDQCAIIHREMGRHYSQVSNNNMTDFQLKIIGKTLETLSMGRITKRNAL